ncbi:hypothetical protein [Telmatospirillum sp.]|uniref:hypothetical protein n=1 Tax=Telmatospirillum sp. TaxID=2079197 RepID=UPI00284C69CB|nr:hypothetical protein [Telmatospirillum sp.]MDR3435831.1 hypothetical protein [Telmatospirillum sp.]
MTKDVSDDADPPDAHGRVIGHFGGSTIGGFITGFVAWLHLPDDAVGRGLVVLASVVGMAVTLAVRLSYNRYFAILGCGGQGLATAGRQDYDKIRDSLSHGGWGARVYARRLTRFLGWVDLFFGDAGQENRERFNSVFGLQTPAALWTGPSFDRCLQLAFFYPIVTVFVIWTLFSHVGIGERALSLTELDGWRRLLAAVAVLGQTFAYRQIYEANFVWHKVAWSITSMVFFGLLGVTVAGPIPGIIVYATTLSIGAAQLRFGGIKSSAPLPFLILFFGVDSVLRSLVEYLIGGYFLPMMLFGISALIIGIIFLPIQILWRLKRDFELPSLAQLAILILFLISKPIWVSQSAYWHQEGAVLLFLGLLTLINAPFDWLSLGITRGLLRRGLERDGLWPVLYAVLDVVISVAVIALLAVTMVFAIQLFNDVAMLRGGPDASILDVRDLLAGIAKTPGEPEFYWVYALLLSTLLPSMINLMIGAASFIRGVPGLSHWLLARMPEGHGVAKHDRAIVATLLTLQLTIGFAIGIALQVAIVYGLVFHALPVIRLDLLDIATRLADADQPGRLLHSLPGLVEWTKHPAYSP